MPELPEVETVRRGLNQTTLNQPIVGGDVLLGKTVAYPESSQEFLAGLTGWVITGWQRRGKYLLAKLGEVRSIASPNFLWQDEEAPELTPATGGWLGVHLRMTGQLRYLDRAVPLSKHVRVRLFLGEQQELRFVDQRTFGQMWWVPPGELPIKIIPTLGLLGPEPFSAQFSVDYLADQCRDRRRPIKTALLDQTLVAGVGNIYADEALFLSQIHPQTLCSQLTRSQLERLHSAIIQVLKASIEVGGTTFSTFLNVEGINGNYGGEAWVYNRTGDPCRTCGTAIQRLKLAGRSAHFCQSCQPR